MIHKTVLLKEAIDGLNLTPGSVVFDGTLGNGGHTLKICQDFGRQVKVIATDRDAQAIERSNARINGLDCDFNPVLADYRNIKSVIAEKAVEEVDGILLDLGLSSNQLEESNRGFTFRKDEPLLMTFTETQNAEETTAQDIVNFWGEEILADVIYGFADERYAKRIARAIVEERKNKPIKTTGDLVKVIERAVPASYRHGKTHFATKTFQALRIAVNDELGALDQGLKDGFECLRVGGRMSIISFHSDEDRRVKNFYREKNQEETGKIITKKPITPSPEELQENPRARSAKLRIIEKIKNL